MALRLRAIACAAGLTTAAVASSASAGDERAISLFNIHNKESVTIVFKRDGQYDPSALEKLNYFLRDWRTDEPTTIDPKLFDILSEIHEELGSQRPIHVVSGYRSPATNAMLRDTRGGQAKRSRHMLGQAMDVHFPDVPVRQLRYSALIKQRGGVGYYPTSSLPFVHVDTGNVRHWPRMPREELALLFPNGRTAHRPPDNRPITRSDAVAARAGNPDLAVQVAAFHDLVNRPATGMGWSNRTVIAAAPPAAQPIAQPPTPRLIAASLPIPAARPAPRLESAPRLASLGASARPTGIPAAERRMLDRLAALNNAPPRSEADRSRLAALSANASASGSASTRVPAPVSAPVHASVERSPATIPDQPSRRPHLPQWSTSAEFDEDHSDELFYNPFPVSPYLTQTASVDDDALVILRHPDASRSLAMLAEAGSQPMVRFDASPMTTRLTTALAFRGKAVLANVGVLPPPEPAQAGADPAIGTPSTIALR